MKKSIVICFSLFLNMFFLHAEGAITPQNIKEEIRTANRLARKLLEQNKASNVWSITFITEKIIKKQLISSIKAPIPTAAIDLEQEVIAKNTLARMLVLRNIKSNLERIIDLTESIIQIKDPDTQEGAMARNTLTRALLRRNNTRDLDRIINTCSLEHVILLNDVKSKEGMIARNTIARALLKRNAEGDLARSISLTEEIILQPASSSSQSNVMLETATDYEDVILLEPKTTETIFNSEEITTAKNTLARALLKRNGFGDLDRTITLTEEIIIDAVVNTLEELTMAQNTLTQALLKRNSPGDLTLVIALTGGIKHNPTVETTEEQMLRKNILAKALLKRNSEGDLDAAITLSAAVSRAKTRDSEEGVTARIILARSLLKRNKTEDLLEIIALTKAVIHVRASDTEEGIAARNILVHTLLKRNEPRDLKNIIALTEEIIRVRSIDTQEGVIARNAYAIALLNRNGPGDLRNVIALTAEVISLSTTSPANKHMAQTIQDKARSLRIKKAAEKKRGLTSESFSLEDLKMKTKELIRLISGDGASAAGLDLDRLVELASEQFPSLEEEQLSVIVNKLAEHFGIAFEESDLSEIITTHMAKSRGCPRMPKRRFMGAERPNVALPSSSFM